MVFLPLYLQLGFQHISDPTGFDHMLFLVALCAVYRIDQWRVLLLLVTAFTLGHSITLALTTLGTLTVPTELVELLIPVTILLTAIHNVISRPCDAAQVRWRYLMALFFGFIHGMGFSNYFRALMMGDDAIALPLLGFNLGIELGQLLVVAIIVGVAYGITTLLGIKQREWNLFVSGAAFGLSLLLIVESRYWWEVPV